jgi:diadenosine tetraphosphate (Ap4A) HIT family hydrolase
MSAVAPDRAAGFVLDARLAADCRVIGRFDLCAVLMMNDAHYPWFILVPRRAGMREIYELAETDQVQLLRESSAFGRALMTAFKGDKLNVAALGNVVAQLHVHHIVRYAGDAAWPGPVWGKLPPQPYAAAAAEARMAMLRPHLPAGFMPVVASQGQGQ